MLAFSAGFGRGESEIKSEVGVAVGVGRRGAIRYGFEMWLGEYVCSFGVDCHGCFGVFGPLFTEVAVDVHLLGAEYGGGDFGDDYGAFGALVGHC